MDKFDKLLEELQSLNIIQERGDWDEELSQEMWAEHFKGNFKVVKYGLNVDTHRWYETSTQVIEIYGRLLGIDYITNMFSESQGFEDCFHTITFGEMKEVKTTTYINI